MRGGNLLGGLRLGGLSTRPLDFPCFVKMEFRASISSEGADLSSNDQLEFLPWLRRKSGREISSMLSIGWSSYGRSLFSSRRIHAGECMLSVPYSAQLSPDITPSFLRPQICNDVGAIGRLAIVLLAEMRRGQGSDWAPYISRLPGFDEMHCLIFWSDDELEMIRSSQIYHEVHDHRTSIEKEYLAAKPVQRLTSERESHDFQSFGWGLKFLMRTIPYFWMCWITGMGNLKGRIFDFLNHDGNSENVLMSNEDSETSEVISARDYAAGEQVLIRYGKFPNATLLLDFGFTLKDNKYDQVQISMDVPQDDPLYSVKCELLQKHCMPRLENGTSKHDRGTFTIKEVKVVHGSGKGIPPALRAFVRVLSANSLDELEEMNVEASENDGRLARRPLKNRTREITGHRILLSQITSMIQRYDVSLQSLRYVAIAPGRSEWPCRIEMARDLLSGELRVLKSAYSWLCNYCSD
ncbi:SET domain-containing protein isoform X3 [Wolffia australiana]